MDINNDVNKNNYILTVKKSRNRNSFTVYLKFGKNNLFDYYMNIEEIKHLCINKENELLEKHFGNLVAEAAHERPESIGGYNMELPRRIENEYKEFLRELWSGISTGDARSLDEILEEVRLRSLMAESSREALEQAHKDATEQTLWERITHSNHKDVTFYKGLLEEYTGELLYGIRRDFLEEAAGEEIKGNIHE